MPTKAERILENIFRLSLVIAAVWAVIDLQWQSLFIVLTTLTLSYLPDWMRNQYHIRIPHEFALAIICFIYASLFLGELGQFYERFQWWDVMLHMNSAIGFGCIGFIIMFYMNRSNRISSRPFWLAIFGFSFALSIGAIWEIFEFSMDQLLGMNMQKSGLVDTMWDLIVDAVGAFLASLAGYTYIRGNKTPFLSRLIGAFIKDNPEFEL